jgi:hypothetical protein
LTNATCYARVEKKAKVRPEFFNIRTERGDLLLKAPTVELKNQWVTALKLCCVPGELTEEHKKLLNTRSISFIGQIQDESKRKETGK